MKKVIWILVAILLVSAAFAQETTAGLQGTVKDPTGAVVSKATVEVSGPALIGVKKVETDQSGYFRFANLPPGEYTLSVTAAGFKGLKRSGISLDTGKLPTIDLNMEVGATEQTVEVSAAAPLVDVATSKVQTNVSAATIDGIPKGRSFQSVIAFAPGARNEPLQGTTTNGQRFDGYQIDGASNSENSYLIEGQETSDIRTGQTRTNAPFEFIQEVQVKTSGFEAEYGGALGGVVNVIQKRGSNAWHGSVFTYYEGDMFNAAPNQYARYVPSSASYYVARHGQFDIATEFIQPKKDHYRIVEPGFEAGGYLLKDRIWLFASSVPRINNITRSINMNCKAGTCASAITGPQTFSQSTQTYYSLARVDARISDKIRAFGSWQYAYMKANGIYAAGSVLPTADDFFGRINNSAGSDPYNFRNTQGFVAPNVVYNAGADITITPNIIATTRFGRNYNDLQDRGLLSGIRYRFFDSNYNYPSVGSSATTKGLDGTLLGSYSGGAFVHDAGFSSMGPNQWQIFDKTSRKSFSQDVAWFKKGFGTHNVKVGYNVNRLANNPLISYNKSQVYVAYMTPFFPLDNASCTAIRAANIANFGTVPGSLFGGAGTPDDSSCMGNWGTFNVREVSTVGNVSSLNHAIYFQDAWTMGKGFTVNAGLRMDKESLPSFTEGAPGIDFGFGSKLAPRVGASWDVFQNGKLKAYGSFGYFYDIMKYSLPRGSFGGDYWHDCVYAMDSPDYTKIQPDIGSDGHFCPATGGANGTIVGRLIENQDFRGISNDPNNRLIDPNLKPMKQHELVFGTDYAINPKLGLEVRYSQKRLDRTIEDSGLLSAAGETFYIVNPGEGIDKQPLTAADCPLGCPDQPKPARRYDSVEARLTKTASEKWFGTFSYTWSKLRGNYSGLTSTDLSDGGGGRADANVSRAFDEPYMQFDAHGNVIDGPLATDRTHTFKGYGYYKLKWMHMESLLGVTQQWFSGTPLSSYASIAGAPVFLEGRGKYLTMTQAANGNWQVASIADRRTDAFSQTDFNFVHELKVSKTNEGMRLGFEANITNLFNQKAILDVNQNMLATGKVGNLSTLPYQTLMTGYDYLATANTSGNVLNSAYGLPNIWQDGRSLRFKVKFTF